MVLGSDSTEVYPLLERQQQRGMGVVFGGGRPHPPGRPLGGHGVPPHHYKSEGPEKMWDAWPCAKVGRPSLASKSRRKNRNVGAAPRGYRSHHKAPHPNRS